MKITELLIWIVALFLFTICMNMPPSQPNPQDEVLMGIFDQEIVNALNKARSSS